MIYLLTWLEAEGQLMNLLLGCVTKPFEGKCWVVRILHRRQYIACYRY